jgi:RNA polymerase sigma-70 factor (ECF subfamily)
MNEHKDLEAVRMCLEGKVDAFETIIVRYQKPVLSLAYRIVRNSEDARDIAQTVFVKAFGNLSSFNPRYKLFSWLYRIAINESLNFVDRRNRRVDPGAVRPAEAPSPDDELAASELSGKIEKALMRLNASQRALLALSADGLSYKDIGLTLELPEKKVKSKLFSARHKLREILGQDGWTAHDR